MTATSQEMQKNLEKALHLAWHACAIIDEPSVRHACWRDALSLATRAAIGLRMATQNGLCMRLVGCEGHRMRPKTCMREGDSGDLLLPEPT